tara:strand:- start:30 stop:608 length:579 start_codon:yes stop_codon:yes gene_type:complete
MNEIHNKLLKLISMFHTESEKQRLQYLIDGGTLLGAIRNAGIIPHDDDIDIIVFEEDEEKLLNVLTKLSCAWCSFKSGYKLFFTDGSPIKNYLWHYPFLDILIVNLIDKKTRYRSGLWRSCYHEEKDIYPLKQYKFNDLLLYGPDCPLPYLDRAYKDWDKKIVTHNWDHKNEKRLKQKVLPLLDGDYRTKYE